ncbi:MAG: penicillin-binding protein 1A [Gammaproteobacteria bacterium]
MKVYAQDGALISEYGEVRRAPVKLAEVPQPLVKAILAAEDDRFYQHPGVDWRAVIRATVSLLTTRELRQGASTITMQLARNFFLTREKTFLRKLNEVLLAFKIERELSKDEILELYLNKIYFGHRAYGVAAAAYVYYGAELADLHLAEIAMLAGLPKAPSTSNPVANPATAMTRRNYVLRRLYALGNITKRDLRIAIRTRNTASLHGARSELSAAHAGEMVRAYIVERYGDAGYTAGLKVTTSIKTPLQELANRALRDALHRYDQRHGYRGPEHTVRLAPASGELEWREALKRFQTVGDLLPALVIGVGGREAAVFTPERGQTTIDWKAMAWARRIEPTGRRGPVPVKARDILHRGDVVRLQWTPDGKPRLAQVPAVEGAFVALDPGDGAILALTGGFDFTVSKFNRVTQARRQPGSGFKPFIYSAALEAGFSAATVVEDAPIEIYDPSLGKTWRPENYSHTYWGPVRLREALAASRNLVSVRVLQQIGLDFAINHLQRFGFSKRYLPFGLSLSLGTAEVTPLELARGYAVFANNGFLVDPYLIQKVETRTGEVLLDRNAPDPAELRKIPTPNEALVLTHHPARRAISAQNAWIMTSMMQDVIRSGTATAALSLKRRDLAGKTGTTDEHKDTWFTGYNSRLVASAWVGFDQAKSLGGRETGGQVALPMWISFMRGALAGMPESLPPEPSGLTRARVDRETGTLTDADNPNAIYEVFQPNAMPAQGPEPSASDAPDDTPRISEQLF